MQQQLLLNLITNLVVTSPLDSTVVDVLHQYAPSIQDRHAALLIENFAETPAIHRAQQDLTERILVQLSGQLLVQFEVQHSIPSSNNLILIDGYRSLQRFVEGWTRQRYNLGGHYWIVLRDHPELENEVTSVRRMLDALWKLKILYVFLIVTDESELDVELFTFWPYEDTHCGEVNPIAMDWKVENLLANRLKNFYGCPLRVGAFENRPFVQLDWNMLGKTFMLGFEGLLVNVIAKRLNFSVEVVTPPRNDQWGYARQGNRSTGLMKLIADETVDFGICSIGYTAERNELLLAGVQHYNSYMVFAVPSGRPYTAFEKLFLPFSWSTWYAVCGVLVIAVVSIAIINSRSLRVKEFIYGRGILSPTINLVNLFLGGPLDRSPKGTFARTLMMFWLIFTLVIRTAYQGSLYKYLQVPKNYSAPLTMDAIDKSGLPYYMMDLVADFFIDSPDVLDRTQFLSHDVPLSEAINQIGRDERHGVVLALVDHIAYHNKFFPKDEYVQAAREAVVELPIAIYYPLRTFLREIIDRQIQLMDSSGLIEYWASKYADYDFNPERGQGAAEMSALTMGNFRGAFQILVVLLGVALGMFAVELLAGKCGVLKKIVDWLQKDCREEKKQVRLFVRAKKPSEG